MYTHIQYILMYIPALIAVGDVGVDNFMRIIMLALLTGEFYWKSY